MRGPRHTGVASTTRVPKGQPERCRRLEPHRKAPGEPAAAEGSAASQRMAPRSGRTADQPTRSGRSCARRRAAAAGIDGASGHSFCRVGSGQSAHRSRGQNTRCRGGSPAAGRTPGNAGSATPKAQEGRPRGGPLCVTRVTHVYYTVHVCG